MLLAYVSPSVFYSISVLVLLLFLHPFNNIIRDVSNRFLIDVEPGWALISAMYVVLLLNSHAELFCYFFWRKQRCHANYLLSSTAVPFVNCRIPLLVMVMSRPEGNRGIAERSEHMPRKLPGELDIVLTNIDSLFRSKGTPYARNSV